MSKKGYSINLKKDIVAEKGNIVSIIKNLVPDGTLLDMEKYYKDQDYTIKNEN